MIGVKKNRITKRYEAVTLGGKPTYKKKVGKIKLTKAELAEKEKAEKPLPQTVIEPVSVSIKKNKRKRK